MFLIRLYLLLIVFFCGLARAEPPAWLYASKLDLACDPESGNICFAKVGTVLHWYHSAETAAAFSAAHEPPDGEEVSIDRPLKRFAEGPDDRELWSKGTRLALAYVYLKTPREGGAPGEMECADSGAKLEYDETERPTALAAGLNEIFKAGLDVVLSQKGVRIQSGPESAKPLLCIKTNYRTLAELRAVVKAKMIAPGATKDTTTEAVQRLITGPAEHWFLSGDVITKRLSEVKFDEGTGTFARKEKPGLVYLGLNWMAGDVYSGAPQIKDRFVAKVMIAAASKPLDSVGAGVGLRIDDFVFPTGGKKPTALVLYAGHYWTKGDDGVRRREWRAGMSFNVETFIGWVKPASKAGS